MIGSLFGKNVIFYRYVLAVQEERLTAAEKAEMEAESTTAGSEIPAESILSAEMRADARSEGSMHSGVIEDVDTMSPYSVKALTEQLCSTLVDWAIAVPHFVELSAEDQVVLLKAGI